MNFKYSVLVLMYVFAAIGLSAQNVAISQSNLVSKGIVEFIPQGFDINKTPSLILQEEPKSKGKIPNNWSLKPQFTLENNKASASLSLSGNVSLYGGGEVTGPLLRNGQYIKLWNTDTGAYGVDGGKRLYQSHPWVMGVREDGTAFGVIFDSSWKSELYTNSDKIIFNTEGALFRVYIIDRKSPQAVLQGLAELTGTIKMPARWTLGYHQSRFSYGSEEKVIKIANTFRAKNIPCDVIWMDIDYMEGYRVFTFNKDNFPNPKRVNDQLHNKGFKAVYMIDPGVKFDPGYSVYDSGTENEVWIKKPDGTDFYGRVWPGACTFPDFTMPHVRKWWAGLYTDFLATGIDGVWNDMNEPAASQIYVTGKEAEGIDIEGDEKGTMPYDTPHRGGGDLPAGPHLLYHNAYGRLMVEASLDGIMTEKPDKRPFLLTRSNLLGGQRYAATWTGDNWAGEEHMKLSVPMSLTLGLSGQPFSGPDVGGFLNNTSADLWAKWLGFGVFLPFVRGHACAGTNDKEPWAFGEEVEKTSRIALERRYRLLPYLYTQFYYAATTGEPVMTPIFFADTKDLNLRAEEEAFLLGKDLIVIPSFAENPTLPSGIWESLSLIDGDMIDKYQAELRVRGGSIIPAGRVVQNTTENSFEPLTLFVCLDKKGQAQGELYLDAGDGWEFQKGDFAFLSFEAKRKNNTVDIKINKKGRRDIKDEIKAIEINLLMDGKVYKTTGSLGKNIKVSID